jgi:hypothetical protein
MWTTLQLILKGRPFTWWIKWTFEGESSVLHRMNTNLSRSHGWTSNKDPATKVKSQYSLIFGTENQEMCTNHVPLWFHKNAKIKAFYITSKSSLIPSRRMSAGSQDCNEHLKKIQMKNLTSDYEWWLKFGICKGRHKWATACTGIAPATKPSPKARVSCDVTIRGGTAKRGWWSGGGGQGEASSVRGGCGCCWCWPGRWRRRRHRVHERGTKRAPVIK